MAGLSKRFCRQACSGEPPERKDEYRGLCGLCRGECSPCDESGNNCGDWQNCSCVDACGDGHNCDRYIDIEFKLDSFIIQGKVCTNANGVNLTQQCGGGSSTLFDEEVVTGSPSGWGAKADGVSDYVRYEHTVHRLRLTRQDCGCYWGGYWSSGCDCNTCCCAGDEECDEGSIYPDCGGEGCESIDCLAVGDCFEGTDNCRPCDPTNPCYPIDNGFASSLDKFGTGEVGGSDGQALCLGQTTCTGCGCGYTSDACDGWVDDGNIAFAGWQVGAFKSHHIEAYFTYQADDGDECSSGWVLEIRGLTELSRSQMGLASGYPALDCTGQACSGGNGGSAESALGYRGKWWGMESVCNLGDHCKEMSDDPPPSGAQPAIPELVFNSCSCPPAVDIESTVRTDNAIVAFHPSTVFTSNNVLDTGDGTMYTCVVNDAQGNNAPAEYCNDDGWISLMSPPCLNREYQGGGVYSEGTCYGKVGIWWEECEYCKDCCEGDWSGGCVGCECGEEPDEWCDCAFPATELNTTNGMPQTSYPCGHCVGDSDPNGLNDPTCNACDGGESRMCTPCQIKIRPNSNEKPWWE